MSNADLINNVIAAAASSAGAYLGARSNKKRLKKLIEEEFNGRVLPIIEKLKAAVAELAKAVR